MFRARSICNGFSVVALKPGPGSLLGKFLRAWTRTRIWDCPNPARAHPLCRRTSSALRPDHLDIYACLEHDDLRISSPGRSPTGSTSSMDSFHSPVCSEGEKILRVLLHCARESRPDASCLPGFKLREVRRSIMIVGISLSARNAIPCNLLFLER